MQGSSDDFFQKFDEEWRSSSDFYAEPDLVTRGVTLGGADIAPPFDSSFKGLGDVDFYHDAVLADKVDMGCFSVPQEPFDANTDRFSEEHRPPHKPADEFFVFALTTLHVICSVPHEIGNILLDFLTNQVICAFCKKVNRTKFAFKGDIFENYLPMCTLKVRVYQEEGHNHFAIEFQRRKGDAIAFNAVFKKACQYLKSAGLTILEGSEVLGMENFTPPPLPRQQVSSVDEASLAPLLEMARLTAMPHLQAEAASALAALAEDQEVASQMCTEGICQDMKMLFCASAPEVDFPTAHLTHLLAQQQSAGQHLARQGLLPVMVEKIRLASTCQPAREELARGVCAATEKQAKMFHSVQLVDALSECIRAMAASVDNDAVIKNLRGAQMALGSI